MLAGDENLRQHRQEAPTRFLPAMFAAGKIPSVDGRRRREASARRARERKDESWRGEPTGSARNGVLAGNENLLQRRREAPTNARFLQAMFTAGKILAIDGRRRREASTRRARERNRRWMSVGEENRWEAPVIRTLERRQ